MSRTNDLQKLVYNKLKTIKSFNNRVYPDIANEDALYPHAVYTIDSIDLGDIHRKDYIISIDIWDKATSSINIIDIADKVEDIFNSKNLPQTSILPTFFLNDNKKILDEDKTIQHRLVEIQAQLYERS